MTQEFYSIENIRYDNKIDVNEKEKKGKAAIYVIRKRWWAVGKRMDQKLYLSIDCGFDKFKCCIGDYLLAFSSKMIDVTNSINALSVADGDNTYIEYKGSVYMFGDSIDQIISMKSNLKCMLKNLIVTETNNVLKTELSILVYSQQSDTQ